jgi:protein TonB
LLQPSPVPATPLLERLRTGAGRRTLAIGLAFAIEALLLILLLSLGAEKQPGTKEKGITVMDLKAPQAPQDAAEPDSPEPEDARPEPQRAAPEEPLPPQPDEPARPQPAPAPPAPAAPPALPSPVPRPPSAAVPGTPARPAPSSRPVYGPPDKGAPAAYRDSARVGTAPNGEPLYAAAWYRKPRPDQLRDYLSTAQGPGWGLIACRTVADYRVEDCVGLGEYPQGSQIMRAVLAAAWEFRVRPPRVGGRSLVGTWVEIRIDYGLERR